jgi:nitrogenase molybdenum-cofactor synthesis protein NifE
MMYYDCSNAGVSLTIGKDAEYYHPDCTNVPWNEEKQPFGYAGVTALFTKMSEALDSGEEKGGIR